MTKNKHMISKSTETETFASMYVSSVINRCSFGQHGQGVVNCFGYVRGSPNGTIGDFAIGVLGCHWRPFGTRPIP